MTAPIDDACIDPRFAAAHYQDGRDLKQQPAKQPPTPEERERYRRYIQWSAVRLIEQAKALGVVVTIQAEPLHPPAMGHYVMVADARIARHAA